MELLKEELLALFDTLGYNSTKNAFLADCEKKTFVISEVDCLSHLKRKLNRKTSENPAKSEFECGAKTNEHASTKLDKRNSSQKKEKNGYLKIPTRKQSRLWKT